MIFRYENTVNFYVITVEHKTYSNHNSINSFSSVYKRTNLHVFVIQTLCSSGSIVIPENTHINVLSLLFHSFVTTLDIEQMELYIQRPSKVHTLVNDIALFTLHIFLKNSISVTHGSSWYTGKIFSASRVYLIVKTYVLKIIHYLWWTLMLISHLSCKKSWINQTFSQ